MKGNLKALRRGERAVHALGISRDQLHGQRRACDHLKRSELTAATAATAAAAAAAAFEDTLRGDGWPLGPSRRPTGRADVAGAVGLLSTQEDRMCAAAAHREHAKGRLRRRLCQPAAAAAAAAC